MVKKSLNRNTSHFDTYIASSIFEALKNTQEYHFEIRKECRKTKKSANNRKIALWSTRENITQKIEYYSQEASESISNYSILLLKGYWCISCV